MVYVFICSFYVFGLFEFLRIFYNFWDFGWLDKLGDNVYLKFFDMCEVV